MSETAGEDGIDRALARFDAAFGRLEASLGRLDGRLRTMQRIEADTRQLIAERARLAADLDKATARAKRLDDSAHEVSRRLVEAMESVRAVLVR